MVSYFLLSVYWLTFHCACDHYSTQNNFRTTRVDGKKSYLTRAFGWYDAFFADAKNWRHESGRTGYVHRHAVVHLHNYITFTCKIVNVP